MVLSKSPKVKRLSPGILKLNKALEKSWQGALRFEDYAEAINWLVGTLDSPGKVRCYAEYAAESRKTQEILIALSAQRNLGRYSSIFGASVHGPENSQVSSNDVSERAAGTNSLSVDLAEGQMFGTPRMARQRAQ
jgi:hypothetical protein